MKTSQLIKSTLLASVFAIGILPSALWAAVPAELKGPLQLNPRVYHRDAITGTMTVSQSDAGVSAVKVDLDRPILGRSSFPSTEQWSRINGADANQQLVIAFKLDGPRHTWYFVFVGTSADGGQTETGTLFKVNAPMADIQAASQNPLPQAPTGWKALGSVTLKAQ